MNRELRIIYMGTPEFAVEPLRAIVDAGYNVVAVITAPDKPAGRGQKTHLSPVKEYALRNHIRILQPVNLKAHEFVEELRSFKANLQVVVAFRMLPEIVWQMPEYGTLNLHASLLPQYRGAAPINHAIMNGETETGLTTFFIEKEIDTGNIILSRKLPILSSDDAAVMHDKLMYAGGEVMLETLKLIETGNIVTQTQDRILPEDNILKPAPKIFKNDCRINWNNPCLKIHNFIRGLSPVPCAYSMLISENGERKQIKIFKTTFELCETLQEPGTIVTDNRNSFSVYSTDGIIHIEELQIEGKKRMNTADFLRGVKITDKFHME
jgi:methionyl-tRNA formyltransferase